MIELQHVSKTYVTKDGRVDAVRDVSLSVEAGEVFGIIGFSGAGKSTLVRCINLLEKPTAGTVTVDGQTLNALSEKQLRAVRKKIAMIFQHFNLMRSRTVAGNIMYPMRGSGLSKAEMKERMRRLLGLVDMQDKENAYPSQLSGGQKQRVAIARALANDPKVLLCDEATSALDPQTTASILQLIKKLNRELGITVVIITHEMGVVKEICDRVAVMEDGRMVEEGEVFSIFANPKQPITQDFIRATSSMQKVYDLLEEKSPVVEIGKDRMILRLTYLTKSVSEPLVSTLSRRFDIDLNIIFSSIEIIQGAPLGGLVAIAKGERDQIRAAVQYLIEKEVGVEVIADGTAS